MQHVHSVCSGDHVSQLVVVTNGQVTKKCGVVAELSILGVAGFSANKK
jgi:hypothetical protein